MKGISALGSVVAEKFRQAAALLADDARRAGNVVNLGSPERVIIAGDIHGNRQNLSKIISHFSADSDDEPILLLQEIIHGPIDQRTGQDRSIELLLRAARLKIDKPDRVYFVLGNHDVAMITGNEITKQGQCCCGKFNEGINFCFGEEGPEVCGAVMEFFRALPIAIRFDNGLMASHSLPSPNRAELAGVEILARPSQMEDYSRGGGAYEWTWGRDQSPEQLEELSEKLGVNFFVLGHRHVEAGSMTIPDKAVAINSDGVGGSFFEFSPKKDIDINLSNLPNYVRQIASL